MKRITGKQRMNELQTSYIPVQTAAHEFLDREHNQTICPLPLHLVVTVQRAGLEPWEAAVGKRSG